MKLLRSNEGLFLSLLLFFIPWSLSAQTDSKPRNVWDGVYASEQAVRGQQLFSSTCRRCHNNDYFASAEALALRGTAFMDRWREDNGQNLFDRMKGFMPPASSGGVSIKLPDQQYLDIIAFLFQVNEFPAGSAELKLVDLPNVQITGPEGPQPVPNLSTVKVIGCLAQVSGRWSMTKGTEPVRTREPETSASAEITASGATALGSQTFELRGLDLLANFNPDSNNGHKLQVKGVLNRQSAANRISVLSVESVGASCGG